MAKTQASIYMNYSKALSQADELERVASEVSKLSKEGLQGCLTQVASHWEGDNSKAYVQKGKQLQEKINGTAEDLKKAAATIRTIAKNTYDAEMRALEIAKTFSGG